MSDALVTLRAGAEWAAPWIVFHGDPQPSAAVLDALTAVRDTAVHAYLSEDES